MKRRDVPQRVRIATRESPLALWQANYVAAELSKASPETEVELIPVSTLGDRDRVEPLRLFGGMGVFTREVQKLVLEEQADIAVHSLKDLPTESVPGLTLGAVPERAPRWDLLVFPKGQQGDLESLPAGARIGTGSPRRQSQLLAARPDLQLLEIRGNVETRLRKLDDGEYDAIVLAEAGLVRLGYLDREMPRLQPPVMFPAVGQAALGIECRANDEPLLALLKKITDSETLNEVLAERACLAELRAGCHAPVGVLTSVSADQLTLQAVVLSLDGAQRFEVEVTGAVDDPVQIGKQAAQDLMERGADVVLKK